jgi:hypothetical protein
MTEQGGNIDLFSANGDISAGEGPKTYVSDPPISLICDVNAYCHVNPSGLVSGAGIAAVITLPGQDPTKSNAVLTAPHGTIDAGAAGIRVAGNLTLSPRVLNAYNIQTQGTITGLPTFTGPNTMALTTANNTAGANQALKPESTSNNDRPSIVIVEFVGFGGGDDDNGTGRGKDQDRHSERQDPNSAVQVLGAGDLSAQAEQYLTADERQKLQSH